jgi:hypothetical protein
MSNIEELKKLALAATPGPWCAQEPAGREADYSGGEKYHWSVRCPSKPPAISHQLCRLSSLHSNEDNDAAYIAEANPQAILALIAETERLQRELEQSRKEVEKWRSDAMYRESLLKKTEATLASISGILHEQQGDKSNV